MQVYPLNNEQFRKMFPFLL
ncbi:MAG: hypothetical protein GQ557_00510 [Mycoplasmataceae bacterium]|nr:hypothetical protein [Mycoplasmataceae bacterium]